MWPQPVSIPGKNVFRKYPPFRITSTLEFIIHTPRRRAAGTRGNAPHLDPVPAPGQQRLGLGIPGIARAAQLLLRRLEPRVARPVVLVGLVARGVCGRREQAKRRARRRGAGSHSVLGTRHTRIVVSLHHIPASVLATFTLFACDGIRRGVSTKLEDSLPIVGYKPFGTTVPAVARPAVAKIVARRSSVQGVSTHGTSDTCVCFIIMIRVQWTRLASFPIAVAGEHEARITLTAPRPVASTCCFSRGQTSNVLFAVQCRAPARTRLSLRIWVGAAATDCTKGRADVCKLVVPVRAVVACVRL